MFDRDAAITAARHVLDTAPRVETPNGPEIAVNLANLVDKILAAGNPDALTVPPYDPELAKDALYRIAHTVDEDPGAQITVTARRGAVATGVWRGPEQFVGGVTIPATAWHLGLAYCSAAQHAMREERR